MLSYAELEMLEALLTKRLSILRGQDASANMRLVVAKWLPNLIIQKAAQERQGLHPRTFYIPQCKLLRVPVKANDERRATAEMRGEERNVEVG